MPGGQRRTRSSNTKGGSGPSKQSSRDAAPAAGAAADPPPPAQMVEDGDGPIFEDGEIMDASDPEDIVDLGDGGESGDDEEATNELQDAIAESSAHVKKLGQKVSTSTDPAPAAAPAPAASQSKLRLKGSKAAGAAAGDAGMSAAAPPPAPPAEDSEEEPEVEDKRGDVGAGEHRTFVAGRDSLQEGEVLEMDASAYDAFHSMTLEWPALSFDIVPEVLGKGAKGSGEGDVAMGEAAAAGPSPFDGMDPTKLTEVEKKIEATTADAEAKVMDVPYPLNVTCVLGPQPDKRKNNEIWIARASNLCKTCHDDDVDYDGEDDEINGGEPVLDVRRVVHNHGAITRLRCMPQRPHVAAVFSDDPSLRVYDFEPFVTHLHDPVKWLRQYGSTAIAERGGSSAPKGGPDLTGVRAPAVRKPTFVAPADTHTAEGFALDWSPLKAGQLVSGDTNGKMFVWRMNESGHLSGSEAARSYNELCGGHAPSTCEDALWSPHQQDVVASCSADGVVKVWDTRAAGPHKAGRVAKLADCDINVLAWSSHPSMARFLATGAEDGTVAVWDMSTWKKDAPPQCTVSFKLHKFSPHTNCILASGDDDMVCFWDLSVEDDTAPVAAGVGTAAVPPQLVFQHLGLDQLRELRFHPQIPGLLLTSDAAGLQFVRPVTWKSMVA